MVSIRSENALFACFFKLFSLYDNPAITSGSKILRSRDKQLLATRYMRTIKCFGRFIGFHIPTWVNVFFTGYYMLVFGVHPCGINSLSGIHLVVLRRGVFITFAEMETGSSEKHPSKLYPGNELRL